MKKELSIEVQKLAALWDISKLLHLNVDSRAHPIVAVKTTAQSRIKPCS